MLSSCHANPEQTFSHMVSYRLTNCPYTQIAGSFIPLAPGSRIRSHRPGLLAVQSSSLYTNQDPRTSSVLGILKKACSREACKALGRDASISLPNTGELTLPRQEQGICARDRVHAQKACTQALVHHL